MTSLRGKTTLITGGASGIGKLIAMRMAKRGARVILWDVDAPASERAVREIESVAEAPVDSYICDVSKRSRVATVAKQVKRDVGPIDILVNNAGVVSGKRLLEIPDKKIESTFGVNTLALFWVTRAFLPEMVRRNSGHIVTIASAAGLIGVSKLSDYSASKFAAVGFDESLRVELRETAPRVRTTLVCPYYVDTGMFAGVKTRFPLLLPILREEAVADRVVDAIIRGRRRVLMPPMVYMVPVMRALPVPVFDAIASFFGINVSMKAFRGRQQETAPARRSA